MTATRKPGLIPFDLLPSGKAVAGPLVLDLLWTIVDGIDWNKLAGLAVAIVAAYYFPDINPPRATRRKVLDEYADELRPGDELGPLRGDGRPSFVVVERPAPGR